MIGEAASQARNVGEAAGQARGARESGAAHQDPSSPDLEVLERGDVTFFFRPSVQPAEAPQVKVAVQRFFFVLSPAGGPKRHRRVRVGRKHLPRRAGERCWSLVERVGSFDHVLSDQMQAEEYATKTRGLRYQPGARPISQGCYAFVRHGDHCHFAYRAEPMGPAEELELPRGLNVPEAASLLVLWKRWPPARAMWTIKGRPGLLDEEDAELVLVGSSSEPEEKLGIELLPEAGAARAQGGRGGRGEGEGDDFGDELDELAEDVPF